MLANRYGFAFAVGLTGGMVAMAGLADAAPLAFPASRTVIPVAVAGAFALPALIAALFVSFSRSGRVLGPILATCLIAGVVLGILALVQPEIVADWITVLRRT